MKRPSNGEKERVPLSDAELDFLEQQVPSQATAATRAAFWNALTRGQSVMCAQGDELYEIAPDGSRHFVKKLEANVLLPAGIDLILP